MKQDSGLLFDLDGTLLDSAQDIAESVNYTLKELRLPQKSFVEIKSYIGDGMKTLLERATNSSDEVLIQKSIQLLRTHYTDHCLDRSQLYPGVLETLKQLKGFPLAIISNKPVAMVTKILEHFGVLDCFISVKGGDSTKNKKPHPEPVLESLKALKCNAERSFVVGDSPMDIQAGRSAGCKTCAVLYGYRKESELDSLKPDFKISEFSQLLKILS